MGGELDFKGLARALLSHAPTLLPEILPGGRMIGKEYVCGNLRGDPGNSLKVNVQEGVWKDFSSDEGGADLINLYAAAENLDQGEAAKRLAARIGYDLKGTALVVGKRPLRKPTPKQEPEPELTGPPPDGTATPDCVHRHWGEPTTVWTYLSRESQPLFYVARYDIQGEGKQFLPWSWSPSSGRFIQKAHPSPRPVYGLEQLVERPDSPVMIVEGEKACDAARTLCGHVYVVISWPNGSKAFDKVDWSPVYGRRVILWPDSDHQMAKSEHQAKKGGVEMGERMPTQFQPGVVAMNAIANHLLPNCPEVKVISLEPADTFTAIKGFDAADAVGMGWTSKEFFEWAKPRVVTHAHVEIDAPDTPLTPDPDAQAVEDIPATARAIWDLAGLAMTNNGSPICNADNLLKLIHHQEDLRELVWFDEFHNKYFTRWHSIVTREWMDIDDLNLMVHFQRTLGMSRIYASLVHEAVMVHAHTLTKNEPKDWMETLTWDGRERGPGFFATHFGADDNPYTYAASMNWWISIAARVYKPGCKVDTMVILEGGQGKLKSTALGAIGGEWYTEMKESATSKDFYMVLQGRLIVEIGELDAFSKAEVNTIKKIISCQVDRFRPPYGRASMDFPRRSVFVGTTNEDQYLRDATGGRRFWPVKIGSIDVPAIRNDREQLFAEAVFKMKRGDTWWEMPAQTEAEQEARRQADEWEMVIQNYLIGKSQVTITDVASDCLKIDLGKFDLNTQRRIGTVMRRIGWDRNYTRSLGIVSRVWSKSTALT